MFNFQTVVQTHILFQEIWLARIWHPKTSSTACVWGMFDMVSNWRHTSFNFLVATSVSCFYLSMNTSPKCDLNGNKSFEVWQTSYLNFCGQCPTQLVLFYQVVKTFSVSMDEASNEEFPRQRQRRSMFRVSSALIHRKHFDNLKTCGMNWHPKPRCKLLGPPAQSPRHPAHQPWGRLLASNIVLRLT